MMSLKQVKVTIKWQIEGEIGTQEVDGWTLAYVPGLALTPFLNSDIYAYNVTHISTGTTVVTEINRIVPALNCLDELGDWGVDWTLDDPGATMTKSQKRRVAQIKEKYHDKD